MHKKILLAAFLQLLASCAVWAQSRIEIAGFSQFQQYYNPSLTGLNSSVIKSLYRNQWTGFQDAPKTIYTSAEFNLNEVQDLQKTYNEDNADKKRSSSNHAFGLIIVHDKFGPSSETQLHINYGYKIRLSEELNLRWGTALTFKSNKLDGNKLTVDQGNDPKYKNVFGQNNRASKADLNFGIALTTDKYYIGYSIADITKGKVLVSGDNYLSDAYSQRHSIQGGYRTELSEDFNTSLSFLYQNDKLYHSRYEGQLKVIYANSFWAGGGLRINTAYILSAGVNLNQLSISYAYESTFKNEQLIQKTTNEIIMGYKIFPKKVNGKVMKQVSW